MRREVWAMLVGMLLLLGGCVSSPTTDLGSCTTYVLGGFRRVAEERTERFLGKVQQDTARCRGGDKAVAWRHTPWLDWQSYWRCPESSSEFEPCGQPPEPEWARHRRSAPRSRIPTRGTHQIQPV